VRHQMLAFLVTSGIVGCSPSQPSPRTSNEQSSVSADCPRFESAQRDRDQRRGSPELLSLRCDRGNTHACAELGVLLLERLARGGDVRRAKRLLTRACDADEGSGCTALGTLHAKGLDAEPDFERAVFLFRRGAEAGDEHGSTLLAIAQYEGLGVPRDRERALELLSELCRGNNVRACTALAELTLKAQPGASREMLPILRAACNAGDSAAVGALGFVYGTGLEVVEDRPRAVSLLALACDASHGGSCANLGVLRLEDEPTKAVKLIERSCAMGTPQGCSALGLLYSKGLGVSRNYDRAFELLQWSCTRADGEACAGLATLYARGHGAPPDMVQSESLFRRACELGDDRGCSGLAEIRAWRQKAGN
jgi:uncharacterized protein